MPLVWAHAEYVKLAVSRALGRAFDRPEAVWQRYGGRRPQPAEALWTPAAPVARIGAGQALWLGLPRPARVRHGFDGWQNVADIDTDDSGLTLHVVQLPTRGLRAGARINFTFFWTDTGTWDGRDHVVAVV
jgi:glucoamylase